MAYPWQTALVTGASSGIGAAISRRLVSGGTDIVLVARAQDRLDGLAAELRRAAGAPTVEVIGADLTDASERAEVETRLADHDRPVDLLVNNAGAGLAGDLADLRIDDAEYLLDLNAGAVLHLTRAALPSMLDRRRGWICNVSSMASRHPSPGLAVYGAAKAFVTSLSESLHEEVRGSGVSVTAVLPGLTRTDFQVRAGYRDPTHGLPGWLWQDAGAVADEALRAVAAGRAVHVCGRLNRVAAWAVAVAPRPLTRRASARLARRR